MHLKMCSVLQPEHLVNTYWMAEILKRNPVHQQEEWIDDPEAG